MSFTYHSIERANERFGVNSITAKRNIENAFLRGKKADEYSSREQTYLLRKGGLENTAIVYNEGCYIFTAEGVCLTVFPLPSWFGKKKGHYEGKTRIRNIKKYYKHYGFVG